jgi:hypothetical protein
MPRRSPALAEGRSPIDPNGGDGTGTATASRIPGISAGRTTPAERASSSVWMPPIYKDVGELETAEAVLEEARDLYRAAGDLHRQDRVLRQDGQALGDLCGRIEEYFRRHWVRPARFVA